MRPVPAVEDALHSRSNKETVGMENDRTSRGSLRQIISDVATSARIKNHPVSKSLSAQIVIEGDNTAMNQVFAEPNNGIRAGVQNGRDTCPSMHRPRNLHSGTVHGIALQNQNQFFRIDHSPPLGETLKSPDSRRSLFQSEIDLRTNGNASFYKLSNVA